MLNISNFTTSQFIQRKMSYQIREITESTERLSSGKRVNRASDDPGSIGPISRLNSQVLSLSKAITNGAEGKILAQGSSIELADDPIVKKYYLGDNFKLWEPFTKIN